MASCQALISELSCARALQSSSFRQAQRRAALDYVQTIRDEGRDRLKEVGGEMEK